MLLFLIILVFEVANQTAEEVFAQISTIHFLGVHQLHQKSRNVGGFP